MACKFEAHNGVDSRLHKKLVDNFKSKGSQLAKLGKEFSSDVNYESQADDLYAYVHGPAFKEWFGDFTKEDLPNTDENGEPKLFKSQGQFYFERQDGAREYITGTDSLFSIEEQKQIFEAIRFKFLENLKEDDKSSLISFISKSENLKQTLSDKNINDVVQALIDDVLEDAENLTDHQITMLERLANSKKAFDDFANQLRKFYSKIGIDFSKESSLNQDEDGNDLDETTSKDLDFSPSVESDPIKNASRALKVYLNHIPKGQIVNGQFQPINDSVLNAGTYESYGAVHKTLIRMFADTIQGDLTIDEYVDEFINKLRENQNELAWAGKIADDLQSMKDNKDLNALKQFIVGLNTHYYNYMLSTFNNKEGSVKYFSTSATESNVGRLLTRWNVSIINTAELDLNALTNVVESTSSLQKQAKELIESGNSEAAVNLFVNNIVDGLQALNVDVKPKAVRDLLKDEKYLGGETELNRALTLSKFFDSFVTDLKSKQAKDQFYEGGETENKMVNIIKDNIFIRKLAEKQIVFIGEDINESVQRPKGQSYSYSKPSHIKDKLLFILNAKSGKSYINDLQTRSYYKYSKWLEYLDSDNADNVSIDMMSHFKQEGVGDTGKDNKDIKIADELTMNIAMMLGRDEQGNPITPSFRTITAGDKSRAFHIKGFEIVQSMFETGQLSEEVIERAMGYLNAELERVIEVQGEIDAIENPEEGRAPVEKVMHYNTGLKNGLRVYFMPELSYEFYREAVEKEPNERSPEEIAIADLDKTIKAITKAAGLEERGLYNEKGRLLFGPNYTNEKVADSKKVAQDIQNAIKLTLNNLLMDKVTAGVEEMRSFYKYPGNEQGVVKLDQKVQSFYSKNRPGTQGAAVLGDYFINQMFANVEYTKMYTGDPAYYKNVSDFNKRVQGTYIDGDKGVFEDGNETFTIAVTESIEESSSQDILDEYEKLIGSKVKSYNKNNVADAQAWISLGRWISIENSLGRWSDKHEEIFNKISKDPKAELTKEEVKFVLDNHPPQSMKGVYFDVDKNGRPTYLKYSQAVLIPQLTQGSPILEKLVDKMTEGKIDEVITSDGIKVGAPADILDKNLDGEFGTLKLKATSWRLQQDLPTKGIKDQDVGSQIMKNILANVDPENNYDVNGQPLTGKQLTDEIFRVINKMSNYGSDKLKAKLFDSDGNIRKDQINKIILDNLEDPDENLISALKRNVDYDSLPQFRVPIMNAIFAEVRKSIRPKTKGIGAIQVSAFGFERITDRSQIVWLKDATTDEDKVLDPPSKKNGYKGDVLISGAILNKMIQNTEPGETYKTLIDFDSEGNIVSTERLFGVNGVLGELKDFGAIGYRIPNQGLSSNDALNIAGILPDIAGDIVVPYKEITTKTGSDFDIDKMYMMFKDVNPPLVREEASESAKKSIDKLTKTIFEEDDFKAKYVTSEEFENIQDANRLIDLYLSILTSENTIEQIITPLDSDDLRKDIRKVAPEQTVNMFDPIENLKLKHKLKGGKNNVGGNANHLVNILYAQLGESKINSDLGVGHMENGVTLLNRFKDANTNEEKQEFITKTLSDFLTAFVDIGKDAYVVDANYNTKTANIAFMLLRAGATKEWVTRFLKQPAIEMLLKEIEVQDASIVGFVEEKNRPFNKVKERILDQAAINLSKAAIDRLSNLDADDATINTRNNFKINRLTNNITDPSKNDNYYEDQITALVMFEKYKGLAQNLADFNQSMRSDVNGAGRDYSSLLAIKNTIAKVELDNVISGLQEVFENTQVGTFYRNSVVVAQDIVNQLFNIGKTDGVVDAIGDEMMGSYITDEETIFEIHNSLYTFFHRTGAFEINEEKQDALFKDQKGSPSLATRIYNLQKLQKKEDFNQEGKFLIDSLVVNFKKIGADKVRHGFIQLPSSTKSGLDFRQNVYESWLELLKSNDPRFRKIGEDLIQYGFYSTGFQKTLGSIYEFIPNEWFFRNNHTSSVQTKFDNFDGFSEEAMDFVYKANMFENKFVPRLSKDQVDKGREQIADISKNVSFKIDIKDPRRFVKIVDKNGSILLFKLRGLDETGKAIYAREVTIKEKIGSVYRFKFPDNPNELTPEQNSFVDSLVVVEEDTSSPSEDKDDVINDVTAAVDDAQTTEQPISQTPVQPRQRAAEVELNEWKRKDIENLFDENPALKEIGSVEEYNKYLKSVFPNSKVDYFLYHGTDNNFDVFDKSTQNKNTDPNFISEGFWFATTKEQASDFGNNVKTVILNQENPYIKEVSLIKGYRVFADQVDDVKAAKKAGNDSAILDINEGGLDGEVPVTEHVVFEPNQIHELGTEKDIQGFKEFVNKPTQQPTQQATSTINIYAGTNENAELSNFANRPFTYGGITYSNVEGAFQAAKLDYADKSQSYGDNNITTEEYKRAFSTLSGRLSKQQGRSIKGLNVVEWNKVSSSIMKDLIKASFEQNPKALEKLLATGNATLTHTQDRGKWGKLFPKILMEVRQELSSSQPTQPVAEVKSISMQPDNVSKILSGQKTTTLRTNNLPSGVYNIGGQQFNLTNRGLLSIEEAGGVEAINKSEAFAESGPKFSSTKDFLAGKRKLYVYDITPVQPTQPAAEVKTSISENIKDVVNKVYPGWINETNNQISLAAEFKTAERLTETFGETPIEQRINNGNRALDFLNQIKKGENPFTEKTTIEEQIPNLLFNYLSGELAKDGILEEDMYDNTLQTTESTDGEQLSLFTLPEESDEEAEARNRCKG
jgi:predicted NAD-dependent protein-ADP-ribosyltransferase YbiA (DUF1768 family)